MHPVAVSVSRAAEVPGTIHGIDGIRSPSVLPSSTHSAPDRGASGCTIVPASSVPALSKCAGATSAGPTGLCVPESGGAQYRVGDTMYTCCSKECVFPVLVLEGKSLQPGRTASHGIRGVCLNWTPGCSHMQRYCASPCDRFVRVDHFGRSDPRRGHSLGHKRRHPGR
jgi:hypothetical protein